jgi:4,5-dihydroxyphthalate decarboxylase
MDELEIMLNDFADDTPPFGMDRPAHRLMMEAMCREQYAQHLVDRPTDPNTLFADFEAIAAAT